MRSRIVSVGMTKLGKLGKSATSLMYEAFQQTIESPDNNIFNPFNIEIEDIDGLIAIPSLSEPHFMMGHYFSTQFNVFEKRMSKNKKYTIQTIDLGGAGPVSALLQADRLIKSRECDLVAVIAGDAIGSMSSKQFLEAADKACSIKIEKDYLKSPIIPNGYNKIAEYYIQQGNVNREQLGMVSVMMSLCATNHPYALTRTPFKLDDVLNSQKVCSAIGQYECAHRTDGAAAILVASDEFLDKKGFDKSCVPYILNGSEASGPLYPPETITPETYNSVLKAVEHCFEVNDLTVDDIDYFGIYDCFPICFIKAVDAIGIHKKKSLHFKQMGKHGLDYTKNAGNWIEGMYNLSQYQNEFIHPFQFPVNTHGGLLAFGAPWEVPALFSIIEAYKQLRGVARRRQIPNVNRALIYGNGGILSASSVAILENHI